MPPIEDRRHSAFSGIPANESYADQRKALLDTFLQSASIFRLYYEKLKPVACAEICAALNGPAFDTLMESLKLTKHQELSVPPPNEEQLQFYMKNFHEFSEILKWQDKQFFGFLNRLTNEQLISLVKSQNPVVSALVLKFCPPSVAAHLLNQMNEKERIAVIDQFERTREISSSELSTIELSVREAAQKLPNFILGSLRQEVDYWSNLLAAIENPARLLADLEQSRPDLYEKLARFRFELQDIPSLPVPLVRRVLDETENDQLARALSRQSPDLVQYVLSELGSGRRGLIQNQLLSYQNISGEEVKKSVEHLTRSFREVLV